MPKLRQTAYASLVSTSRYPRWWILALVQVAAFSGIGRLSRPHMPFMVWLLLAIVVLVPVTAFLWLDIQAAHENRKKKLSATVFLKYCLTSGGIIVVTTGIIILARLLDLHWTFLALFASFIAATASLAILYVILCGQNFGSALTLAIDTWHYKISMVAAAAAVLILANGVSYAFVHGIRSGLGDFAHFSVYGHSATIWVLLAILIYAIAFFSAVLNCFLVYLFLEIIARKKDPETEREMAKQPAYESNI